MASSIGARTSRPASIPVVIISLSPETMSGKEILKELAPHRQDLNPTIDIDQLIRFDDDQQSTIAHLVGEKITAQRVFFFPIQRSSPR